jgi:hypothetical protein
MAHSGRSSKSEYNKPQLKAKIDAAMAAYLRAGHTVERVPSAVVAPEPAPPAAEPAQDQAKEELPPSPKDTH